MVRRFCILVIVGSWIASAGHTGLRATSLQVGQASPSTQRTLLDQYCVTCHNERSQMGGLALDAVDVSNVSERADVWEKVVRKLRAGMMPPVGRPRPERAAYDGFAAWLETELDRAAAAHPNPGRTETFHRLNRTQYHDVIRDLLALDVDVMSLLPADDASYGFDNIAGVLKVNQTRMERYLAASRKVARMAVGHGAPPTSERFNLSPAMPQYDRAEGLPFGTRGGTLIHYNFPQDGEYVIKIDLACLVTRGGDLNCDGAGGFPEAHQLEVTIDGERVQIFTLASRPRWERYNFQEDANDVQVLADLKEDRWEVRVPVKAGPREVGVTFVRQTAREVVQRGYRRLLEKPTSSSQENGLVMTAPHVREVTISGPFEASGPGDTPSRRAIFVCYPASRGDEAACANTILSKLARRAYRRPVTRAEVQTLLSFYVKGREEGEGFDGGIERALQRLLMSPGFLVRVETDPPDVAAKTAYRIGDVDLASRISFFLWNSIPDEELLGIAERGQLHDPAVLERQVRRMLADPRSAALTTSFVAQWLSLRDLGAVTPSPALFPDFDESLRQAMRRETELFFNNLVREDRSVMDLLTANYTFVNDRLARHYGLPNIQGSHFRRVTLGADSPRRGLLGQGSILTITSHANRTSPVRRGKWILENILGTPPPPPPANVPPLPEKKGEAKVVSIREQMAAHRANPVCASCHAMIDPAGFALENFDPIGRFRTVDEDVYAPIDASGALPDGNKFNGVADLRTALVSRPERFVTTLTEKVLIYALGRGVEYDDMPTVRNIVHEAARHDYRFSSVILGVVSSVPFQMRGVAAAPERLAAARQ